MQEVTNKESCAGKGAENRIKTDTNRDTERAANKSICHCTIDCYLFSEYSKYAEEVNNLRYVQ